MMIKNETMDMMEPGSQKLKDSLRPALFWDMDFNTLNLDEFAAFVVVRVMERGTREEVRAVWNYYGAEIIR